MTGSSMMLLNLLICVEQWTKACLGNEETFTLVHTLQSRHGMKLTLLEIRTSALGKARNTHGKGFAECRTRQRALGKELIGKEAFAECFLSGTRRSLCRVPEKHSAKWKCEKNQKIIANFFFGEGRPSVQRHRPSKSLYFLRKIRG